MKKKVLIWEVLPFLGGGQKVSLQVGLALKKKGEYEVEFLVPSEGALTEALEAHDIVYHYCPLRNYSLGEKVANDYLKLLCDGIVIFPKLWKLQQKERFDILYIGGARAFLWGAIFGQLFSLKVIWHIHNIFKDRKTLWLIQKFGSLPATRKVLCVSESVKIQHPLLANKTEVLSNPIDIELFEKSGPGDLISELRIPKNSIIVTSIGILQPGKRQDLLIRALREIIRKLPDVYLLMVGQRRAESNKYADELEKLVLHLELEGRVLFLGRRDDVHTILKNTDVTVVTGEEGCSLVMLESFAAAVPVVGPDVAGCAELIGQSHAGVVFRNGDAEDLAKVLISLLSDADLREELSKQGLKFIKQHCLEAFGEGIHNAMTGTFEESGHI